MFVKGFGGRASSYSLLLRRVFSPSRHVNNLEGCRDGAIFGCKHRIVNSCSRYNCFSLNLRSFVEEHCFLHSTQMFYQLQSTSVSTSTLGRVKHAPVKSFPPNLSQGRHSRIDSSSSSICAIVHALLYSFNVSPPRIAAKNKPSGFNTCLRCIIAPGRSFVQWSPKQPMTRSRQPSITSRNSSSPTTNDVSIPSQTSSQYLHDHSTDA